MLRHLRHASWHCRRLAPRCLAAEFAFEFACRAIPRIRSKGGPPPVAGAHACLLRRDPRLPLQTQCQTLPRRPRCRDRFARHDESVLREPPPPRCALQRFSALPARLETDRDLCPSEPAQEPLDEQRSEEHTSELQSPVHLVCRLLLEKKNETLNDVANCCDLINLVGLGFVHPRLVSAGNEILFVCRQRFCQPIRA